LLLWNFTTNFDFPQLGITRLLKSSSLPNEEAKWAGKAGMNMNGCLTEAALGGTSLLHPGLPTWGGASEPGHGLAWLHGHRKSGKIKLASNQQDPHKGTVTEFSLFV
jgi:hypothetical protein